MARDPHWKNWKGYIQFLAAIRVRKSHWTQLVQQCVSWLLCAVCPYFKQLSKCPRQVIVQ